MRLVMPKRIPTIAKSRAIFIMFCGRLKSKGRTPVWGSPGEAYLCLGFLRRAATRAITATTVFIVLSSSPIISVHFTYHLLS